MRYPRIAILDANDMPQAYMDLTAPKALHYYSDELHSYIDGAAMTFTFKCPADHPDALYLIEGAKLSFVQDNRDYYFNIVKVQRDEWEVEVESYGLMFELLNTEVEAYKSERARTFLEYLEVFDSANVLDVGINEVMSKAVTHEWEGSATLLARLFSLANVFGAEIEFVPKLSKNQSLEALTLNIYKKYGGVNQGIGSRRNDVVLRYGHNIEGIIKTSDITELRTAIKPIGKDGLTISALNKEERDEDGTVIYKSPAGSPYIYAVQACQRFPSNLLKRTTDRYITGIYEYDTESVNTLYGQALARLKELSVPKVTYEVTGFIDSQIGDTVRIADEEFNPTLYLDARVTEQVRSFTDPLRNKTVFDNFRELQSEISPGLLRQMTEMIDASKQYICHISASEGIVFRNGIGSTVLKATVFDGGADVTDRMRVRWFADEKEIGEGIRRTVEASSLNNNKAIYKAEISDQKGYVRAVSEVTVVNVFDGHSGNDALTVMISTDKGTVLGAENPTTVLTAHVYCGGNEAVVEENGTCEKWGRVKWYGGVAGTYMAAGRTLPVTADAVGSEMQIIARLESDRVIGQAAVTLQVSRKLKTIVRYYKCQSESEAIPEKPTAYPPSGWSEKEPDYEEGKVLYSCLLSTFSDGWWAYTNVSRSSSYTAVQSAIRQANATDSEFHRFQELTNIQFGEVTRADADIMEQVRATYVAKGDIVDLEKTIESRMIQGSDEIRMEFQTALDIVQGTVADNQLNLEEYIRFRGALIELGKLGNDFVARLSNDRLAFLQNDREIAYISNNKLYITDAEVKNKLTIGSQDNGYFDFIPRSNGNLSLKWRSK